MEESTPGTSTTHGKAVAEVMRAAKIACFMVANGVVIGSEGEKTMSDEQRTSALICNRPRLAPGITENQNTTMAKVQVFQNLQIAAQS